MLYTYHILTTAVGCNILYYENFHENANWPDDQRQDKAATTDRSYLVHTVSCRAHTERLVHLYRRHADYEMPQSSSIALLEMAHSRE